MVAGDPGKDARAQSSRRRVSAENLAALYEEQGRLAEAEPLYKRALTIRGKTLRPDDPDLVHSLSALADLYHEQGRNDEAEPLLKRSLTIQEKAQGPDHPDVAE